MGNCAKNIICKPIAKILQQNRQNLQINLEVSEICSIFAENLRNNT